MDLLGDVIAWFGDSTNWSGPNGVPTRVLEHARLSAFAVLVASLVALPPAVVLAHLKKGGVLATSIVNLGRAIPSFAVVALALPFSIRAGLGIGFWPTFLALFLLAIPPIFTNAFTGVRTVPESVSEAARGMGMRERQVLLAAELPLAAPLILTGLRVASVQVVATATLGALVGWGGLGRYIVDGFAVQDNVRVFAGALLVAAMATATELGFGLIERLVRPADSRAAPRPAAAQPRTIA